MATNIEIKARAPRFVRTLALAEQLSGAGALTLRQEDVFFKVPHGRLKLRILAPDRGELIFYQRQDTVGPKQSDYHVHATTHPASLCANLTAALGTITTVRKLRRLFHVGQTRIHLDAVEGLGEFIELEVVMRADQPSSEGVLIANQLMQQLEIAEADLIDVAYGDLLLRAKDAAAAGIVPHSTITCPACGHRQQEAMPTDACQFLYDCKGCGALLRPRAGDCCVFCSYGNVPCPPVQAARGGGAQTHTAADRGLSCLR